MSKKLISIFFVLLLLTISIALAEDSGVPEPVTVSHIEELDAMFGGPYLVWDTIPEEDRADAGNSVEQTTNLSLHGHGAFPYVTTLEITPAGGDTELLDALSFDGEYLPGLDIFDLEGRSLGDLAAAAVEPVQPLRAAASPAGRVRGIRLLRVRRIQLGQRFLVNLAVRRQAVSLLKVLHGRLCAVSVVAVHTAGIVAQLLQPLLHLFHRAAGISRLAGAV